MFYCLFLYLPLHYMKDDNRSLTGEPVENASAAPIAETDAAIPGTENPVTTPDMEVHHHPQLHHKPKPWKEYLFEYLMIVLAVTTGFFAESLRERIGEKSKEKEYLSSMVADLRFDTTAYNTALKKIYYLRPLLDSLYTNVRYAPRFGYVLLGKWNTPINESRVPYMPTMPTIQQLKSSGNMRLIQSRPVLNKVLEYETFVQGIMQSETTTLSGAVEKIYSLEDDMCDESEFNAETDHNMQNVAAQYSMDNGAYYNMPMLVKDSVRLNMLANSFINYKSRNWGYYTNVNRAKQIATELLILINDHYHLQND